MRKIAVVLLIGLLLTSFISPFSYAPNPLGLAYLIAGGYSYDARLPFLANRFATFPRPGVEDALLPKLDALRGATGLDPLDPNHPLLSYQIETVTYGPGDWAQAKVRMTYSDGSSRYSQIPVVQSSQSWGRPGGWAYTGLDRYFTPHLEVPYLAFAGPGAPIRLGAPKRLSLAEGAHLLGARQLTGWYTSTPHVGGEPIWSPDGDSFLLSASEGPYRGETAPLWLVRFDGSEPLRLTEDAQEYAWSRDGEWIVFLRNQRASVRMPQWDVVAIDRHGRREQVFGQTSVLARPAASGGSIRFLDADGIHRVSMANGESETVTLPDVEKGSGPAVGFAISLDGRRLAHRCGDELCLNDERGGAAVKVELGAPPRAPSPTPEPPISPRPQPAATLPPAVRPPSGTVPQRPAFAQLALAWSPSGDRLAAVASDYAEGAMPTLWVVNQDGNVLRRIVIGPNGLTRTPQWTPDGRWIFLNTFPAGGRRILAVDSNVSQVYDLSQPRWDTFFSLAPDGQQLLLWNGRGGVWTVPVSTRPTAG